MQHHHVVIELGGPVGVATELDPQNQIINMIGGERH
jgi:hypothetical protein